jgi:kynurenine formamidase
MFARSRLRVVAFSWAALALLATSAPLAGCHKRPAGETEAAPSKDSIKQSYDELKPQLVLLRTMFSGLRQRFEALPEDLPGLDETRAKLLSAEEVLGVTGGRVTWLSGELDSALQTGKNEPLQQISKQIADTSNEMRQLDRVGLELTHQLLPFEQMAIRQPQAPSAAVLPAQTTRTRPQ